ncbi:MAG: aminopeptidase, partial [Pirellulaceae bacterium]|nr:aminopeptidase [Pirellulaceae bacterium]
MRLAAICLAVALTVCIVPPASSQVTNRKYNQEDKFRQLEETLPTPNRFRTASGAPGPDYWQQQANYVIDVELDDVKQRIIGSESITYTNRSPDTLRYLWVQLDPNLFAPDSDAALISTAPSFSPRTSFGALESLLEREVFDGGVKIDYVKDAANAPLEHTVVKTMMRVELPRPLAPGRSFTFSIGWNYAINNSKLVRGRTGYEYFKEDKNYIYEIAQWYPRMAAYSDATGWQHKQYLGRGEFTLELGDYVVRITAPDDHVVAATGVLLNSQEVLTDAQQQRLEQAKEAKKPVFIVTPEEAAANQKTPPTGKKTWIYQAENVRDFAFASSRKFIWDALE